MGVHGLTTYLRENTHSLSTKVRFPSASGDAIPIVVDGLSFLYNLYQDSRLPWVFGGEHPEFSKLIVQVVETWLSLGLKIYFVFDGPLPDLKFPTVITRLNQSRVQPGLLFFRTSSVSRTTARFLNETRILPPLAEAACVDTLQKLAKTTDFLEVHFADEEGDPYTVELAGRVGGYVAGNDSDFVILNVPGYRGYIPMGDMVWESTTLDQSTMVEDDDDHEFQVVRKGKKKVESLKNQGLIPPKVDDLTLVCKSYHPVNLASHLQLPVTLLPLLGALVGNDYTAHSESDRRSIQSLFFERKLNVIQRIENAADAMRKVLSPSTPRKKNKHQVGSVMDLIDRTVTSLLTRLNNTLGSGEIDEIIDKVVTATLQYAISKHEGDEKLWETDICALHNPDICPFLPLISRRVLEEIEGAVEVATPALIQSAEIRTQFVKAYRNGELSHNLLDALSTGTYWPKVFLENPDLETTSRSIARGIRVWVYSILDDSLGLPVVEEAREQEVENTVTDTGTEPPTAEGSEVEEEEDDDDDDEEEEDSDDELIDVVESDDEENPPAFLAPLKNELQRLHASDEEATDTDGPVSIVSQRSNRVGKPKITEYIRKGIRIAPDVVSIPPLRELLSTITSQGEEVDSDSDDTISLVQKSEEERLAIFFKILDSDIQSIKELKPEQLQPVLTIRWIAHSLHNRSLETGSRDRENEKWTPNEIRCCLAAFFNSNSNSTPSTTENGAIVYPPIHDRNVQLTAQLLSTLEVVHELTQVLLLCSFVPRVSQQFSGQLFHSYLTGTIPLPYDDEVLERVVVVCQDGLEYAYGEERMKKSKKTRKVKENNVVKEVNGIKKSSSKFKGGFSLLAGLE